MSMFNPHIIPVYPPDNHLIFEEWFAQNYPGCNTDRELLPIFPTSFHVNNGYGAKAAELQEYCDTFPYDKRYFVICQYDDGCLVDWKGKDVLEFNMSKTNGVMIPLLCQPHPYSFKGPKKWLANFVGSKTHSIRESANELKNKDDYYISFEPHNIETYCRILHESIFTICYRGYGINSFRIAEALQYGSIPVYISDDYVHPYDLNFNDFGVLLNSRHVKMLDEKLSSMPPEEIIKKQDKLQETYNKYFTYESNLQHIINHLETEFDLRQQGRTVAKTNE